MSMVFNQAEEPERVHQLRADHAGKARQHAAVDA